jgi:predicted PurR-regulated permease PerM
LETVLWGAIAFLLNYIPTMAPLFGTGILLSFDSLWGALLLPVLYFGIHLVELTPMLLAAVHVNPVLGRLVARQ